VDLRPVVAVVALVACGGHQEGARPAPGLEERVLAGGVAPSAGTTDIAAANPFKGDRPSAAEGERTFAAMNCDGCHGGGAVGFVGPSLRDGRWRYGGSDGQIYQSIFAGRPRGMPAYGGLLPAGAIWRLVTYLQSLEPPANVPTESWR